MIVETHVALSMQGSHSALWAVINFAFPLYVTGDVMTILEMEKQAKKLRPTFSKVAADLGYLNFWVSNLTHKISAHFWKYSLVTSPRSRNKSVVKLRIPVQEPNHLSLHPLLWSNRWCFPSKYLSAFPTRARSLLTSFLHFFVALHMACWAIRGKLLLVLLPFFSSPLLSSLLFSSLQWGSW